MTAQAIGEVSNAFLAVFALGCSLVVAGVAGPLRQGGLMTVGAGVDAAFFLPMIHREGMWAVILGWPPGGSGMAV